MTRALLSLALLWPLSCWLTACVSTDSALQTARMVEPGSNTYTFGYHYLTEHDDDVWSKRLRNDYSDNFNSSSVATGANFLLRRGLWDGIDFGANLSFGVSSLEPRFALYNGKRFATALGTKLLFPTFSLDVPRLYHYKLAWYNSFELLPSFAIYAVPAIDWKPLGREKEIRSITAGLVVGKDSGFVAEATYAYDVKGEDPKRSEQFIIGYTTGLDKLQGRLRTDTWSSFVKVLPQAGFSVFPIPSLGLIGRYLSGGSVDYEGSVDLGIGPIPHLDESKVGFLTSRVYALKGRYHAYRQNFVKLGLARKELRGNFELAEGWRHIAVVNHGLDLSWEQVYGAWQITWLGVYVPLLFLPHSQMLSAPVGQAWEPSDTMLSLASRFERGLSFSLLNVHKEF